MSQKALGMVETKGILAAYEAADVALKSANVKMVGYEISRGGLVVIKFTGDVSAVRSAVDAAKAAASQLSKVWSSHVIARPAQEIESMINSKDTVNSKNEALKNEETAEDNNPENDFKDDNETNKIDHTKEEKNKEVDIIESEQEETEQEEIKDDSVEFKTDQDNDSTAELEADEIEKDEEEEDICNLCEDPACPRSKGDLHKDCIHYDEIKNDE